jgi:hypothetical protein
MEHVTGIEEGFRQMARMVKPGGIVYSMASPLWCSPAGHHMATFAEHPWIHLLHDRESLLAFARENGIAGQGGTSIEHTVSYMLSPFNFNMRPAADYVAAAEGLPGMEPMEHEIILHSQDLLSHRNAKAAMARGYSERDLLGATHRYVARKRRRPLMARLGALFR